MSELWRALLAFWKEAQSGGAYVTLAFAALLFCAVSALWSGDSGGGAGAKDGSAGANDIGGAETGDDGGRRGKSRRIAAGALAWCVLWMNPLTAMLVQKVLGVRYHYANVSLLLPVLPLIAYVAAELVLSIKAKGAVRGAAVFGLAAALMLAGSVYPYGARAGIEKYSEASWGADSPEIKGILEAAGELEKEGQIPFLSAPKEIMERIRRYDPDIVLVYGRNLWQPDTLNYVMDGYTEVEVALFAHMEEEAFGVQKTAMLSLSLGCNLIALQEPLDEAFLQERGLRAAYGSEGFYLYVR